MAKNEPWPPGEDNLGTEPNPVPPRPPPPRRKPRKPRKVEVPEQVITSSMTSSGGSAWIWLLVLLAVASRR